MALPRKLHAVPRGIDAFLPVKREVVAILGRDDLREPFRQAQGPEPAEGQAGCGDAAILKRVQGRGDGCGKGMVAPHVGRTHDAPAQEARGLIVDLLGDFPFGGLRALSFVETARRCAAIRAALT